MQLQSGTLVLNSRFRVERLLGAGGSGEVYLATRKSRLSGQVALKILRRGETGVDTGKIESYRARFELEGRLQDELGTSPGIVRVIDDGDFDGSPVLVMDYMSGGTLKDEILGAAGKRVPWQRCADILREAATGLQALHARGYVHRDVKPSNILLDAQHNAKIADLGVVQTEWTRTRTDGTPYEHPRSPGYCSPEHANPNAALSPAADVYALGVIGFEMLSGHLPQPSELDQPIEPIGGDAPDWFKAVITRMLAYDYRERPKTGEDVAHAIRDGLLDEREGAARRAARMTELGQKIDAALKMQPHARTELDEADRLLDELLGLAPNEPSTLEFSRKLTKAMRDAPVAPPPPPPPEPVKPLTRRDHLRQVAELRLDLDPAQRERRWDDVVRLAEALLDLAPDDRDAISALDAAIFEQAKRNREIAGARETLSKRVVDRAWDQIEAAAQALLALVPDDPEALLARAELAAELERRRVAAARQKAENEARATLRKVVAARAWDSVADAAAAVLALAPGDGEALKAQADLRAERERVAAHARAVAEARGALRTALDARDWKNVPDRAVELLALAPDDAEAPQAQAEHQAELERRRVAAEKKHAEDAARDALRRVVRAQDWDRVERCAAALLSLVPGDAEAIQARAELAAELERRRVAAAREKAEDEARATLRTVMAARAWDSVSDAAAAVLALAPGDGEALKAQADLRAERERVAAHARAVTEARGALRTALSARDWKNVADWAAELLALAPDDAEALQAQAEHQAEGERQRIAAEKKQAEDAAREALRRVVLGQDWDHFEHCAAALLSLLPGDPEAFQARADLAAELERRRVAAARQKAEDEARAGLRKVMGERAWDHVEGAAVALLALVPGDGEALKARADLRAERERVAAHMSAVAEARGAMRTALADKDLKDAADWTAELLRLAPDDREALESQAEVQDQFENQRLATVRSLAEEAARMDLRRVMKLDEPNYTNPFILTWDEGRVERIERAAQALLLLSPQDTEAMSALSDLHAVVQLRRVLEWRSALQQSVADHDWARAADAARALLALAPHDAEALKAEADARAHLDFRPGLRRVSADRFVLAIALGVEMEFVRVPAGPFLMGSNRPPRGRLQRIKRGLSSDRPNTVEDLAAQYDELPQHRLILDEYWIAKCPTTVAQFTAFVKATGHVTSAETDNTSETWTGSEWIDVIAANWAHPGGPKTDVTTKQDHPVTHMSWDDCIVFCAWVSKLSGAELVLPSEAEWEKAARGTDGRIYPWGNEAPDATRLNCEMIEEGTTPVGKYGVKGQSPYGCDDMLGNVFEMTRSLSKAYPYVVGIEREDPASRNNRVIRSASFGYAYSSARCAFRQAVSPYDHRVHNGFRVILRPPSFDLLGTGLSNL